MDNKGLTTFNGSISKYIRDLIDIDKEIEGLSEKLKLLKKTKMSVTDEFKNYLEDNKKINSIIELHDSTLQFCSKKEYEHLSFQYLEKCLLEIVKNKEQSKYILEYIKKRRGVKETLELKRKFKAVN